MIDVHIVFGGNLEIGIHNIIVSGSESYFLQNPLDISLTIIRKIFGNNYNKIYYYTLLNKFIDFDQMELIQLSNITNKEVSVYSSIVGPLLKIRSMRLEHKVIPV